MANAAPALVRIGVVGHGTVGAAFTALVARQADHIEARTGVRLVVTNVAVRNVERHRSSVGTARLSDDPLAVVGAADTVRIVVGEVHADLQGKTDDQRQYAHGPAQFTRLLA